MITQLTPQEQLIASIRKEQIDKILHDVCGNIELLTHWKLGLYSQLVKDQEAFERQHDEVT
jgi:hypothetical protein